MTVHLEQGYLEPPYLIGEYSSVQVLGSDGLQFTASIDYQLALGTQFNSIISTAQSLGAEFEGLISSSDSNGIQLEAEILDKLSSYGVQLSASILDSVSSTGLQTELFIGTVQAWGAQFQSVINDAKSSGLQYSSQIVDRLNALAVQFSALISTTSAIGVQYSGVISDSKSSGLQFNANPYEFNATGLQFSSNILEKPSAMGSQLLVNSVAHHWAGYLVEEYLVEPYLVKRFTAHAAVQFKAISTLPQALGAQFQGLISRPSSMGLQFSAVIDKQTATGIQFDSVRPMVMGLQFRAALYNSDNLRILCEFPSRGTGGGNNWTTNSVSSGDFSINNVNTDIVEQKWRSAPGVITGIKLECDTGLPQGVFTDTLALLGHNMTTSATVLVEGDDDPAFLTPGFSETLVMETLNTYWISPSLPLSGYRYWRFSIDDPTNTNGYIEIGTILFGESVIFAGETFSNPVRLIKKHFSDKVYTEGFTNVANDRSMKKSISLNFQSLYLSGGNYSNLTNVIETARTNLKCLWIPTPKYPSRYAVFGKLPELPSEEHNDLGIGADYVSMSVEVDESL